MTQYRIVPGVTANGESTWKLLLEAATPWSMPRKLAENPDKAVLERAIEHLNVNADNAGVSRDA